MSNKDMSEKYFEDFLKYDMQCNYWYSVVKYTKSENGYFDIGMSNIEELIYDADGELKDDAEEYSVLIERFYDYLINNTDVKNDVFKDLVENIASSVYEKTSIYCY